MIFSSWKKETDQDDFKIIGLPTGTEDDTSYNQALEKRATGKKNQSGARYSIPLADLRPAINRCIILGKEAK